MDTYERSAHAYDLIQRARGRDYSAQADLIAEKIRSLLPTADSLLDVACGTGRHLANFRRHFGRLAGLDISTAMAARARQLVPDVPISVDDMRSFKLDDRFAAVTCLFSSIGYLLTLEEVHLAVANMAVHLTPEGVLVVEPWIHPDEWRLGHRVAEAANDDRVAVARVSVNGREGHISTFDLHWTIASEAGVEQFVEPHRMGLYSVAEYAGAFEAAGLTVQHDPHGPIGRGLFIGQRQ